MSAGKILLGFGIAMATGAVLGMLFAPDKGSTTRKQISKQGSRYASAVKSTAQDVVATVEEKVDNVKEAAVDLSNKAMDAVDSFTGHEPEHHKSRA